jgi:hypothetical protein
LLIPVLKSDLIYQINYVKSINTPFEEKAKQNFMLWVKQPSWIKFLFKKKGEKILKYYVSSRLNNSRFESFIKILDSYRGSEYIYLSDQEYYSLFLAPKDMENGSEVSIPKSS